MYIYNTHICYIWYDNIYIYVRMFIYSTLYTYIKVVTTQNSQNMNQPLYPRDFVGFTFCFFGGCYIDVYTYTYMYTYIYIYIYIYVVYYI